jgi:uncharacterized membrane protein
MDGLLNNLFVAVPIAIALLWAVALWVVVKLAQMLYHYVNKK